MLLFTDRNDACSVSSAFASVDGKTFGVIPASPSDVDLYTRTTALKMMNPDLRVYISVGGWAFNVSTHNLCSPVNQLIPSEGSADRSRLF